MLLHLLMSFLLLSAGALASISKTADEQSAESRGYSDYESWKPQSSTPDVILIKQKEPDNHHHHGHGSSLSAALKDNLPLLAVLAPLAAAAVLLPLKAFLLPNFVLYPPATPAPPAPPARGGEARRVEDTRSLAAQVMEMIEQMDKAYADAKERGGEKA